ncbi:MAG TPA: matrixin family metalloprotease [Bryobacteraceae bacterium]|jgi:uncharacterized protein (TIGR03437 family)|nr:matrixin family metalloprotease [Bryobacteraceae bacterium]
MQNLRRFLFLALLVAPAGFGYIRLNTGGTTPVPLIRSDNTGIQFFLNNQIVPNARSSASGSDVTVISRDSNPQAAVHAALATWNAVTTANISFLPLQSTSAGIASDLQATIAIGSTPSDVSAVGSALAITVNNFAPVAANVLNGQLIACNAAPCTYPAGGITDSDIILNPGDEFSTTGTEGTSDLQAVLTHELGHSLGANHTGLLGGTMYPYVTGNIPRNPSSDDLAFVNSVYPATSAPASFGTISGAITAAAGPIAFGLVTMIDTNGGNTVGTLTNSDGTFSIQVPPATYIVYAEPYNSSLSIGPGNFYLTSAQAALVSTFQSTMFGGFASPTQVNVAANGTSTVDITVTTGSSPVNLQLYGFGGAGKSGDVLNLKGTGPTQVASGSSIDFVFIGTGLDATLTDANFRVYGQGISVHPGTVRVDKVAIFPQGPLIRATLDIPARTSDTLASIVISTPAGTQSLSGVFTVTPPTPTTTPQSVVSSASGLGNGNGSGAVSPGGIYTVYDIPGAPNLGPGGCNAGSYIQNGPFDAYGNLPTTLAGVTVTFDGVPAPLFLSWGCQLNLQVPFEVAGKTSTQVIVSYLGSSSAPVTVPVLPVQPALYVSCGGVCAVNIGADGAYNGVNSAQNPAPAASILEVFGTGVGVLSYTFPTGQGAIVPPSNFTTTYTYSIGGSPAAPAAFGGWAYGTVGEAQWNLVVPSGIGTGAVPIVVTDTVTGASSQSGAKIFVK